MSLRMHCTVSTDPPTPTNPNQPGEFMGVSIKPAFSHDYLSRVLPQPDGPKMSGLQAEMPLGLQAETYPGVQSKMNPAAQAAAYPAVTGADLFDAIFKEDNELIAGWLKNNQIKKDALCATDTQGRTLPVYLTSVTKMSLSKEVRVALINMVPQELIDQPDAKQRTPLLLSVSLTSQPELTDALLRRGANPNARDANEKSVLMYCAENPLAEDQVRYLCRHGVHLNAKDAEGRTALHYAVMNGTCPIVPELVAAGADKYAQDIYGKTPMQIAEEQARADDDDYSVLPVLKKSSTELLAAFGAIFGDGFRADLLKACTLSWETLSEMAEYARNVVQAWTPAIFGENTIQERVIQAENAKAEAEAASQPEEPVEEIFADETVVPARTTVESRLDEIVDEVTIEQGIAQARIEDVLEDVADIVAQTLASQASPVPTVVTKSAQETAATATSAEPAEEPFDLKSWIQMVR
ncbi:hypothetical protein GOQ28_15525 [Bordetella sp. 02P26C-1]|nr:hypothetical protein [Bordetella sp. 02P26C-1]